MLINQIEKSVCLLLDKRMDFWPELLGQAQNVGLNLQPFLVGKEANINYNRKDDDELPPIYPNSTSYPTWHNKPNAYNAWKSHQDIFRQAQQDGVNNLLLLEDDAFFESDFVEILEQTEDFWKKNKWDAIYFGSYQHPHTWCSTDNKYIVKTNGAGGFHGVLLSKRMIDKLLSFLPIAPYDSIAGMYLHNIMNCYAFRPSIISQRDNIYSFVEASNLTKPSRHF